MSIGTVLLIATIAFLSATPISANDEEISLFNSKGKPVAYIAVDDGKTIYSWSGKPEAYLESDANGKGFHVYGFNGKHLGWFVQGVIRDHDGDAACAIKERMQTTELEPFKAFKEFKPFKAFKEFAPFRPAFSQSFSDTTCSLFLSKGGE
jgi:hypothetical protein